ncbi:MAG: rane protein of unknown function [Blastococcus sp.]|nr:rane protein of unknown function [Blastococcus sp.]
MPTSPLPAEDTSRAPAMPTSVRVAVIVMAVLAALLLTNAVLLWIGFDAAVTRIVRESDFTRADARQFVMLSLVPNLVMGLLLALAAWFLPRRQPWARWIGLATTGVLTLLTLFQVLAAGGITIASLLLLVLSMAAVTSLVARTTGAFVPKLRARA